MGTSKLGTGDTAEAKMESVGGVFVFFFKREPGMTLTGREGSQLISYGPGNWNSGEVVVPSRLGTWESDRIGDLEFSRWQPPLGWVWKKWEILPSHGNAGDIAILCTTLLT